MIAAMLVAMLAQSVAAQAAPPADEDRTIVVTAKRLDVTAKALKACIERNCPPDEEVAAALAHAENQFIEGDYRNARRTLHDTIGRVDRQAKDYPVPVANIWRAESRIAAHLGERAAMQSGQFEAIDALKAGLSKGDHRVLLQRLQVADTFIKQGKIDMGRAAYNNVIDKARALKAPMIEGTALLRIALFDAALANLDADSLHPSGRYGSTAANYRQVKKSVGDLLKTTDPALTAFRDAARLIDAQVEAHRGNMVGIDTIAAEYAAKKSEDVVLLFKPMMRDKGTFFDPDRAKLLGDEDFNEQWVDISFLVGADGRVKDIEVLRESPKLRNDWVAPVIGTVRQRRYAPIALSDGLDGARRVERYTMTAFKSVSTGTRVASRGVPRLEMIDLTAEPPRAASTGGTAAPAG